MDELTIVVQRKEELPGHTFTARLVGAKSKGFGHSVNEAIEDLWTTRLGWEALKEFEDAVSHNS